MSINLSSKIVNKEYVTSYAKGGKFGNKDKPTTKSKPRPSVVAKADPKAERSWWEQLLFGGPSPLTLTGCGEIKEGIEQAADAAKCGIPEVRGELKACGESSRNVSISLKLEYLEGKEPLPDYELNYINEITALLERITGRMVKGDISLKITLKIKSSDKFDIETKIEDSSACGAKMTVEVSQPSGYSIWPSMRYLVRNFFHFIFQHAKNNLIPEHILGNLDNIIAQHAKERARIEFSEVDHEISKEDWDWVHENLICGDGLDLEIPGQYEWSMGEFYKDLYEYEKAIEAYNKALEKYPGAEGELRAKAQWSIGFCYKKLGEFNKAIEEFNKFLENYPDAGDEYHACALYYTGQCYSELHEHDKAIEAYQKVIEDYPDSSRAKNFNLHLLIGREYLSWAKNNNNDENLLRIAIEELLISLENYHSAFERPSALGSLGECYELLGEHDKAIEAYKQIIEDASSSYSKNARFQLKIANLYLDWAIQNGNDENLLRTAIEEFTIYLENFHAVNRDCRAEAQYNIGVCYELLGDLDEAIEAYQKVIEDYPDSSWADDAREALERLEQNL